MIKRTIAAEQQNQRTLEDHTQIVELTSAAWHCAVALPMIDSVDRVSSVVAVKGVDKVDFPAETAGDGRAMLAVVP